MLTMDDAREAVLVSNLPDQVKTVVLASLSISRVVLDQSRMDRGEPSGPFICGLLGQEEGDGLPPRVMVCPVLGAAGFAVYKKERDYSEPGY